MIWTLTLTLTLTLTWTGPRTSFRSLKIKHNPNKPVLYLHTFYFENIVFFFKYALFLSEYIFTIWFYWYQAAKNEANKITFISLTWKVCGDKVYVHSLQWFAYFVRYGNLPWFWGIMGFTVYLTCFHFWLCFPSPVLN